MLAVAVADRHAAEQHLVVRQLEIFADDVVEPRPGLLRAGVEAVAACQKCQRMDIATEIGPLAWAQAAIDGDEQRHWRAEELEVLLELSESCRGIGLVDAE